jgi:hypothetical protein
MKLDEIKSAVKAVTKGWTKQRKAEERSRRSRRYYIPSDRTCFTDIAYRIIPQAYLLASSGGTLPAHARQIFYKARGPMQAETGRPLESSYFTQTLLPNFMRTHRDLVANWRVAYDPRGHLWEPHTKAQVPLGTLEVDHYLNGAEGDPKMGEREWMNLGADYPTKGPLNRYGGIFFIEKEGFKLLLHEVKLAERYDLAIMSTKGQSVVAARKLVDNLCYDGEGGVPLLILHDFDVSGMRIKQTLVSVSDAAYENERIRYDFHNKIQYIDLGLRLDDVEKWNLTPERDMSKKRISTADLDVTDAERAFLNRRDRVELNEFASGQFIEWIESKLAEHGIKKVVPDNEVLDLAYRRAYQTAYLNRNSHILIHKATAAVGSAKIPTTLRARINKAIKADPTQSWDRVLAKIAGKHDSRRGNGKKRGKEE